MRFLVQMSDFVRPAVSSVEEEVDGIAGNTIVLKISVTGHPEPKVQWRCSGSELPGNERRFELLSDGSLQISDFREEDAGLYQCTVTNTAGTSQCQIRLNVGVKGQTSTAICMQISSQLFYYAIVDQKKDPVAVDDFEEHVKVLHDKDNDGFILEFSVT